MKRDTKTIFMLLFLGLMASVFLACTRGAAPLAFQQIVTLPLNPIVRMRLMRILAAVVAGSGLAVSGIVLQSVLRNPLAEPYLLGTSSGAGLGAVVALCLGFSSLYLPLAAFLGALMSIAVVYALATQHNRISQQSLILSGVIVSVGLSALIVFLVTFSAHEALHGLAWWLWGSLRVHDLRLLLAVSVIVAGGIIVIYAFSQDLNAMSIGDEEALHLGIPVEQVKKILLLCAAVITSAIVCICGIIGFVGLMVPHMMRFLVGPNHRALIPASCLAASVFMVISDVVARTAFIPLEIPIGVITAIIGAPVFILLMKRS